MRAEVRVQCGPHSALPPYFSASGLLSKPPHGDPSPGERLIPSRHACLSVPSSTSNHFTSLPACLITEASCRRAELDGLDGRGRRLFVHVWHLLMDQWVRLSDREPSDGAPLAELWRVFPPQPSELALPAARRRGFVLSIAKEQRDLFSRCRLVL